jgi:thiol:disulfide interchange protein DsbD
MKLHLSVFAAAAFTLAASASAQNPVTWTATAGKSAAAGGTTSVKLSATIQEGWHIYSITQPAGGPNPTRIVLPDSKPFTLDGSIKPTVAPDVAFDKNFNINVETYEKGAEFTVPLKIDKSAKAGTQQVHVNARYQVCNSTSCLPPKTVKLTADVKVKKAKSAKNAKNPA